MEYKIRPHHGLCIAFFEGKGYSPEFVRHMEQTIANLKQATIQLVQGAVSYTHLDVYKRQVLYHSKIGIINKCDICFYKPVTSYANKNRT